MNNLTHNFAPEFKLRLIYTSAFRNIEAISKLEVLALTGDAIFKCDRIKLLLLLIKVQMLLVTMVQFKLWNCPLFFEKMSVRKYAHKYPLRNDTRLDVMRLLQGDEFNKVTYSDYNYVAIDRQGPLPKTAIFPNLGPGKNLVKPVFLPGIT